MSGGLFSVAGIRTPAKTIPIAATGSSAGRNSSAGLFAITIEFRAELSSHLHNVLRTLPRVARRWSAQEVARRANAEDDCTGRFWENRFQCRECTDESAILLCGLYVEQGFGHAVG